MLESQAINDVADEVLDEYGLEEHWKRIACSMHLVVKLSQMDRTYTPPKVDSLLGAACDFLERWLDEETQWQQRQFQNMESPGNLSSPLMDE